MKARAVVRDVGRVMDIPYADVDRVAKVIPPALDMTLDKALDESPALKEMQQKDERDPGAARPWRSASRA